MRRFRAALAMSHIVACIALVLSACGPVQAEDNSNKPRDPNVDKDGDGWTPAMGDCDDDNPNVHPGMMEIPGNGIDDNCDGFIDSDFDGDGWTTEMGDCDDYDATVYPGAPEDGGTGTGEGTGKDNDCDGIIDNKLPSYDDDGDGFTELEGDCNDYDPNINPGAYDVPDNLIDEDCSGVADDTVLTCDEGILIDDQDPMNAARAMGLCHIASETGPEWGVISARWIVADGREPTAVSNFHIGHGILPSFGNEVVPREGERLLVLSSGTARQPGDPGFYDGTGYDRLYTSGTPWGYQPSSPNCSPPPDTGEPHDSIALELRIRVPTNALSASFDFNFFTYEYPSFICTRWNDYFVAMIQPTPPGQTDPNVSFDSGGNPISVNNALLQVCSPPGTHGGIIFDCPLGGSMLQGTGFEGHAATGWLQTTIATEPENTMSREIVLLFAVWDSGDGIWDSTALIDNWQWLATPATGSTTKPVD